MLNFNNKIVLVTGGSRGIGEACVKMFLAAGASVAFTYKNDSNSAQILCSQFKSGSVKAYKLDVEDIEDVKEVISNVENDFGTIDILVNNAEVHQPIDIENFAPDELEDMFATNLKGVFYITGEVAKIMKRNNSGRIVNLSSTATQQGEAGSSHYAASKGAINSFTKSLAIEFAAYGINVNAVAPGWVDTPMNSSVFSNEVYKESERLKIPVQQIANAEDIAGPILFLASDLANHITGGRVLCG